MRSSEVTKTETPKAEPQKTRVKKSLIDSPHPKILKPKFLYSDTSSFKKIYKYFFSNVGSPKEDIFLGHILCPIFQSSHITITNSPVDLLKAASKD